MKNVIHRFKTYIKGWWKRHIADDMPEHLNDNF